MRFLVWCLVVAVAELKDISKYSIGDIPEAWRPYVSHNISDFGGEWRLAVGESDPIDEMMQKLGFGWFKRRALRGYASRTDISLNDRCSQQTTRALAEVDEEGDPPAILMTTYFPYGNVKSGVIPVNGKPFEYRDTDTGVWVSTADWYQGRLLQKRFSDDWGIMYDVRVIFTDKDVRRLKQTATSTSTESPPPAVVRSLQRLIVTPPPLRFVSSNEEEPEEYEDLDTPLMLFRWTLIPRDGGRILQVDRWSHRVGAPPPYTAPHIVVSSTDVERGE